jgi:ssDNA-binding Zn-finger/Zn-ribbon topoisomerase 1
MKKNISCPHCKAELIFKRDNKGKIIGTVAGGGIGFGISSSLGIAGVILGAPIAIPATLVGVGLFALLGNKFGKDIDNKRLKCPKCKSNLIL